MSIFAVQENQMYLLIFSKEIINLLKPKTTEKGVKYVEI